MYHFCIGLHKTVRRSHGNVHMSKPQFFWGNDAPDDPRMLISAILFGWVLNTLALLWFSQDIIHAQPAIDAGLSLDAMRGVLLVTMGWCGCFFSAMGAQIRIKQQHRENEDATFLAERAMMNSLEHAIPSLLIIWLSGIYCNSMLATVLGSLYVFGRLLYPIFYGWYGHFTMLVEFATHLGYFAIGGLYLSLMGELIWNQSWLVSNLQHWFLPFVLLGGWFAFMGPQMTVVGWGVYAPIYERGLRWKKQFDERL